MMDDLISRRWLFDRFNSGLLLDTFNDYKTVNAAINEAPAIDAVPVIRAHWTLKDQTGHGVCSHCNRQDTIDPLATHCRYCGAKLVPDGAEANPEQRSENYG